uniref:HK97 family phage prohead protease n=1 Tax=Flavobacterium filum TaxID=370974 RepID=UPI0023F43BE8
MSDTTKNLYKSFRSEIKDIDEEERTITHYISSENPDREGDIIIQNGINFTNFESNPIVCYNHYNGLQNVSDKFTNIGRSLWQRIENGKTLAKTLIYKDIDLAEDIWTAIKQGYVPSWSVGYAITSDPIIKGSYRILQSIELLEYSLVLIPAHTEATSIAFKNFEPKSFEIKNIKKEIIMEDKVLALETKTVDIETNIDKQSKELKDLILRVESLEKSNVVEELPIVEDVVEVEVESKNLEQEE